MSNPHQIRIPLKVAGFGLHGRQERRLLHLSPLDVARGALYKAGSRIEGFRATTELSHGQ